MKFSQLIQEEVSKPGSGIGLSSCRLSRALSVESTSCHHPFIISFNLKIWPSLYPAPRLPHLQTWQPPGAVCIISPPSSDRARLILQGILAPDCMCALSRSRHTKLPRGFSFPTHLLPPASRPDPGSAGDPDHIGCLVAWMCISSHLTLLSEFSSCRTLEALSQVMFM